MQGFNTKYYLYKIAHRLVVDSAITYFSLKRRLSNFKNNRRISNLTLLIITGVTLVVELYLWHKLKILSLIIQLVLLPIVLKFFNYKWVEETAEYINRLDTSDNELNVFYLLSQVFSTISDIEIRRHVIFKDEETYINQIYGGCMVLNLGFYNYNVLSIISDFDEVYCKANYVIPKLDSKFIYIDLDYLINVDEDSYIKLLIDNNLGNDWENIKNYKSTKRLEELMKEDDEYNQEIMNIVRSKKAVEIIKFIDKKGIEYGLSIWNLNKNSIIETDNALMIRCILNEDTTINNVKTNLPSISKRVRVETTVEELSDKGSLNLVFQLKNNYSGRKLTTQSVINNATKNELDIGNGDMGEVILKLPKNDFPATLVGGLSRSGKSTLATMMITSILSMKNDNGSLMYNDVFIGTVKDEDYSALRWDKAGMYISGTPLEVYKMLTKVDEICTGRKNQFIKNGVINIKQFNEVNKDHQLSKMLIVVDEYANLLSRADSEYIDIDDKKVKLKNEIERLCVKIAQEHISRGATLMIITQNFAKNALGKVYDALGTKFIGYAPANVSNSIDNTQELANAMKNEEQTRQGLFFINAPDLKPANNVLIHKMNNGFYKIRTNFLDTQDVKKNFKNKYDTAAKYKDDKLPPDDNGGNGLNIVTDLEDI